MSTIQGAAPQHEAEIRRLYDSLVAYFKEWMSYERMPKASLNEAFARTSRLNMDSMQGADKQSKIGAIMASKYGRQGRAESLTQKLQSLSNTSANLWWQYAEREAKGKPIPTIVLEFGHKVKTQMKSSTRTKAIKMVASKGLKDNIESVINVKKLIGKAQALVAAGQTITKPQAAKLASAFSALQPIANLISQTGASLNDSDASYYHAAWLRQIRESRERCADLVRAKGEQQQGFLLQSLLSNCNYFIEDLKRYQSNWNSGRKPKRR